MRFRRYPLLLRIRRLDRENALSKFVQPEMFSKVALLKATHTEALAEYYDSRHVVQVWLLCWVRLTAVLHLLSRCVFVV